MDEYKKLLNSFLNETENGFRIYLEKHREEHLVNRKDYSNISKKISKIKTEYPKAQEFLENKTILDMTDNEKDAVLQIIDLQDDRTILEELECFKLGFKEAYIFFEEMGMLNV